MGGPDEPDDTRDTGDGNDDENDDENDEREWWDRPRSKWPFRIVVMRHATHSSGSVRDAGRRQIGDVAGSLAEWCHFKGVEITDVAAFTLGTETGREVVQTANLMEQELTAAHERYAPVTATGLVGDLDDELVPTYVKDSEFDLRSESLDPTPKLVVLNEPQAGWFIHELSRTTLGLRHGELVLLERVPRFPPNHRRPYRAVWTMAPHAPGGDELLAAVHEKVAGKMRTAGVLGGLIVSLLTFVLTQLATGNIAWGHEAFAGLVALGIGAALFFVALFFYDSLTMPAAFWGSRPAGRRSSPSDTPRQPTRTRFWSASQGWLLERPPSATSRVVQLNMVRIWSWVFRPAILSLGVGVACLLFALDEPVDDGASSADARTTASEIVAITVPADASDGTPTDAAGNRDGDEPLDRDAVDLTWRHGGVLAAATLSVAGWSYWFRPRIGAND